MRNDEKVELMTLRKINKCIHTYTYKYTSPFTQHPNTFSHSDSKQKESQIHLMLSFEFYINKENLTYTH